MNKHDKDHFEKAIEGIVKEALGNSVEKFKRRKRRSGRRMGFEDLFDIMQDVADEAKKAKETIEVEVEEMKKENPDIVEEWRGKRDEEETSAEEIHEHPGKESALRAKIDFLQEKIELLEKQLKDKDMIIALLKNKSKE